MRLTLALLALALLVSGCSSHAPPASGTQGGTGAPGAGTPGATPAMPTHDVSLYKFDDLVTGGSAPNPADTGGAADQVPLAKTDTFTVANGTLSLSIAGDLNTGSGSGRIEIYAPGGVLAWSSDTYDIAGAPGVVGVGVTAQTASDASGVPPEGAYEVRYYVAGAMQASVEVTATLAGAA
jgi:hypothetical protein